ncbi:MAG: hypothetical protein ACJARI_003007 [Bacteroidia bacterium]|jgi:hypothetical protein
MLPETIADKSDSSTFATDKRLLLATILFGIGQIAIGAWPAQPAVIMRTLAVAVISVAFKAQ